MLLLSQNSPTKTALCYGEQNLSFAYMNDAIQKMAKHLLKLPEGILILQATAEPQFIIQFIAALSIKKPIALSTEQEMEERRTLLGTHMTINAQGELLDLYENKQMKHHPHLALILFTSGSTGRVKAVQLSLDNILANCHAVIEALEFSKTDDQLLFLPLSYSFGLLGQLLPGLISGLKTQIISQFTDIKTLLETGIIPQMWSGVPSHWVAISRMATLYPESATQIRAVVSAGAPLAVSLRSTLKQCFPNAIIYNNYGLTEASPRVLTYSSKDPLFLENYAGYPVGDWQIRLSEDNELLIKGSQIMLGYLDEEQSTRIHDGWLSTGDLAEMLPSGLIAIKGRGDNQINIAGEKVNLTEVEHKVCQIEGVRETIVLPISDELYGMRLVVCLESNPFTANHTDQELIDQLKRHFLPRKFPFSIQFVDKLPRNQNGKLDRKTMLLNYKEKVHDH
ncbi:MAG: class I adenylate-forming enzyme family protein [Legionella sp.]|uniref:class I adenylate-forming enzyme family protein n=1 Tax=Legionella sp. TaxID=459 RepID=UPI00283EE165|nr:class I adenylate-forming enzyme family protein [Legionella sp.]